MSNSNSPSLARFDSLAFSRAIAGKLKYTGIGVHHAAELTGVSAATISRTQRGRSPDVYTLARLLAWLEQPFESFVVEDEDNA